MNLDLILKDVTDPVLRENFFRIQRYITENTLLGGDFKFLEADVQKDEKFPIPHGLNFVPTDIIPLSSIGDFNYYFRPDLSDRTNVYVHAKGPVRLRFFCGKINRTGRRQLQELNIPYVAPETVVVTTPTDPPPTGTTPDGHTYYFTSPSNLWVINHNLGYYPATTIFNNGSSQVEAEVNNISMNQTRISFTQPTAGFARLL